MDNIDKKIEVEIVEEIEITGINADGLFQMATEGEWDKVVEIYRNNPKAHKAKNRSSGDTAVHIAVSEGKEDIVKQLIDEEGFRQGGGKEALEIKNDKGNTPLHVAFLMGNEAMCELIAGLYPSLVGVGNANRETPIFLAVQDGKKDIFLKLLKAAEGDTSGEDTADECIKNALFHMARKDKWDKVVNIYKWTTLAHKAKIAKSGDTALHLAISDDKEEIVEQLVGAICPQEEGSDHKIDKEERAEENKEITSKGSEGKEVLKVKNKQGNTALHVAASMGSVGMCQRIAQVDPLLVGVQNGDGETPFFLAALHGKKDAFLYLRKVCGRKEIHESYYSRRNDDNTILHVAVAGDYFDLAYQIIKLYPDLVNCFNQEGFTPLHLLADNPSNFKSGSHLGPCRRFIYHCIRVERLHLDPRIKKKSNAPSGDPSDPQPTNAKNIPKFLEKAFTRCIYKILSFENNFYKEFV